MRRDLFKLVIIGLALFLGGFFLKSIGIAETSAEASASRGQEISYRVNDGLALHAWLSEATRDSLETGEKAGLALLFPMLSHTHDSYELFRGKLNQLGYATLAFDLRGHGKSILIEDDTIRHNDMTPEDFQKIPADISSFLSNFRDAYPRRYDYDDIIVIGASIGANTAGLLLDKSWVHKAVLLSPGKDYRGLEPGRVMTTLFPAGQTGKPVYIAASMEDKYSAESSQWLFDNYGGTKIFKKYPGQYHGTDILYNVKDADRELIAWLKK